MRKKISNSLREFACANLQQKKFFNFEKNQYTEEFQLTVSPLIEKILKNSEKKVVGNFILLRLS